jgi:hypothetical protein
MARRILGDYPEALRRTLAFVEEFPDLAETPAQFQERCAQTALRCFWEEKEAQVREQADDGNGEVMEEAPAGECG